MSKLRARILLNEGRRCFRAFGGRPTRDAVRAWRQRALARAANGCIERDDDGRDVMAAATGDGLMMTQRMIGGGSGVGTTREAIGHRWSRDSVMIVG